ncbi:uncharacterized protein LOC106164335 isoform X2 [Lingula anatina]|uniref:Uncharacterized protein LOC106164335 isoform X2 n=1 Tax=Lingula anatina TaxID=7574 RepID=A0A2R2MLI9_LINAN|nr:uncharacterized protein LOC106164335 isoform X2 [Lingula anatina]|eukprot:XP_023931065.1 uncharacterized protein LOC106164335 isoform X2 [Lingula anatina]
MSVLRMYCQSYVCDLATRNCSGLIAQIPDHEEEHVLEITSVDCCPWLELFVTVAKDHHLKLWDYHNKLVREIVFDASLRSACFANERGDLLVGYQNHISYIPADKYLPVQYLEKLVELELQDDVIEEPIAFDARVQLNFDLEKLPSGLTHFTRDISYSPGRQVDVEWDSSVLWEATQLALPEELGVGGSTPFKLSSAHVHVPRVLPRQLYGYDTVIDHSVPPPSTEWGEEAADDTDKEMVKESKDGKEKGMEDEKKVQKRKYPIAPDGYIPNSVVRRLIPGFRTQPDFLQLQQASKEKWTLDKLPVFQQKRFRRLWGTRKDSEDFLSREEEEDSSSDKPFFWDEESDEEVSTVDEEVSAPDSAASQDQETKTEPRKFLDIKLGKFEVNKVDWNSFRRKKGVFAAKEKFKSLPKPSDITEAKEEAIETKPSIHDQTAPQATKATKKEVPELLVKISREPWFPTGYSLTVVEVIRAFNTITDNLSDTHQRELSQYIVEIFKTLGIPYVSLVDTVDKCLEQLEGSSRTAVKRNAAWVLGELGVDQQKVITGLVKKLLDRDAGVVDECLTALKKIKGVENKADLLSLINNIETLKKLDTRQLENEALYELANRLQVGGSELEQEEVMKRIQSWIHNAQTDLTTDVTTDQDKTDGAEYDKKTTEQERKRKQAVASIPKAEASKVTSKSVLRLPGVRNKAAESLTKIAGPGEVAPVRIKTKQLPAIRLGTKPESPDSRPVSQASSGSTSSGRSKKPSTPKFLPNRPEMYRYYGRQSSVGSNRSTPTEKVSAAQGPSDQVGSEEGETRKGVTTPKTLVTQEEKDIPAPLVTQPDDTSGVSLVTPWKDTVHAPSVVLPPVVQKSDNVDSKVSAATDQSYKETVSTLPTLPPISDNKLLHQHLHDKFSDYDSDIHSASVGPGSQFWEDGSLQNLKARDYMSADDSGFSCISDQSTLETSKQELSLVSRGEPQLSPVKSVTLLTKEGSKHDNWRQFFERTSALDRKRIAEVKEDIAHGKHKPLPQTEVSYIKHKRVQFVPGDAGVRLLHTITISGDKLQEAEDSRHFISAMPGRLGMHTTSETFGHSKYGILNMNWTTNVPVPLSNFRYQQWRKRQQPKKHLEAVIRAPPTSSSSVTRFPQLVKLHELKLMESAKSAAEQEIPKVTYRWESPLPPPPGRRSRLGDADTAKQHNHYCEYYNLAKKKMHHFTSTSDVTTLPKLVQKVPSVHSYLPPHPSPDHNRTAVDSLPPVNLKAMTARS